MRNLSVQFTNSRDYSLVYILKKIQNNYEYIVIDTPPNLNVETRLALVASNLIVIPTLLEKWAVRSIDIVLDYIEKEVFPLQQLAKIDLENILILPTLVEKNRKLQKIVLADLKEKYKIRVLEGIKRKVDVQKLSYIGCKNMLLEKVAAYNEYKEVLHNIIKRGD
jgi:chromosome partitioning protein